MFHTMSMFKKLSMTEYKHLDNTLPKFSKAFLHKVTPNETPNAVYDIRRYGFTNFKINGIRMFLTKKHVHLKDLKSDTVASYLHNEKNNQKRDIDSLSIYNFIKDSFTVEMLLKYIDKISLAGDFYTLETARNKILESNLCRSETKNSLIALLTQSSRQMGWGAAAERINSGIPFEYDGNIYKFTPSQVDYMINLLSKMGINAVTVPKGWSSDYFPGPVKLISNAIKEAATS